MAMGNDLGLYQERVVEAMRRAVETGRPEIFENEGPDHARAVVDVMLRNSSRTIDVVARDMDRRVWNADSISGFLARNPNGKVRVLLDGGRGGAPSDNSGLRDLPATPRVEVRAIDGDMMHHFCVADGSHVRLEFDKVTRKASITFGDPEGIGERASAIFETMWRRATPTSAETAAAA